MQCENVEIPSEAGTRAGCKTQKVNIKNKEKGTGKRKNMKTRKLFSRIMAAVVAMILVLGMNITALADSTLTVNGTKANGGNVTAYKLFDRTEQELEGGKKAVAYTLISKYEGFFTQEGKVGEGKTDDALSEAAYNYVAGLDANTLSQFAADMWKWISENNVTVDNSVEAGAGTTTMNLPAGYYLIFPAGAATLTGAAKSPAILQDVDGTTEVSVNLKSEYPTVEKKIIPTTNTAGGTSVDAIVDGSWEGNHQLELDDPIDGEDNIAPYGATDEKPASNAAIGDIVTYQLKSKVPDMSGYQTYTFKFEDTLSKGLDLKKLVSVKVGTTTLTASSSGNNTYALNYKTNEDGTHTLTVTFNNFLASFKDHVGEEITVVYTAALNKNAAVGIDPNTNKVKVEYSNDPSGTGTGKSEDVEAKVYTLAFGIFKYSLKDGTADEATNRKPLANAQFKLYADEEHNTEIKLVEETSAEGADKVYYQAKAGEAGVEFIEADATGKVTIKGLKEGTYYLAETKAPAGFNKLVGDIKVEIGNLVYDTTDTTKLNSYDVTYTMPGEKNGIKVTVPTDANLAEIPVLNKAGSVLPSTGGMGTVVFTIAGAAIIAIMLVSSLVSKKRKRSE